MDEVVLDDKNVILDDGDIAFMASKTRDKTEEVIVISDSKSVPESAPVSPVKKKVKREDGTYPLGE